MNFPIKKYVALCATLLIFATSLTGCGDQVKEIPTSADSRTNRMTGEEKTTGTIRQAVFVAHNGARIGVEATLTIVNEAGDTVDVIETDADTEFEFGTYPIGHYTMLVDIEFCTHSNSVVNVSDCVFDDRQVDNPIPFTILAGTSVDVTIPVIVIVQDGGTSGPPLFTQGRLRVGTGVTIQSIPGGCGPSCNDVGPDASEVCGPLIEGAVLPDPLPESDCYARCGGTFGATCGTGECLQVAEQGDGPDDAFGMCDTPVSSSS